MPIKYNVKKYKCVFKCGTSNFNEGFIEHHEKNCWNNPKNKTCVTCKYGKYQQETDDEIAHRWCDHPDSSEKLSHFLDRAQKIRNYPKPLFKCKHHTLKDKE